MKYFGIIVSLAAASICNANEAADCYKHAWKHKNDGGLGLTAGQATELCYGPSVKNPALASGEYISNEGGGTLTISEDGNARHTFSIETMDRNHSMCHLEGLILSGEAIIKHEHAWKNVGAPEEPCKVQFNMQPNAIRVTTSDFWACSGYCGVRTSFGGDYLIPAKGCDSKSLSRSLDEFKRKYEDHAFSDALATITAVLSTCTKTMDWITHGKSLNGKAQAEHQLGMSDACLQTLAPLSHDAGRYPLDVRSEMSPDAFYDYYPIVETAQHLLTVCAPHIKPAERAP